MHYAVLKEQKSLDKGRVRVVGVTACIPHDQENAVNLPADTRLSPPFYVQDVCHGNLCNLCRRTSYETTLQEMDAKVGSLRPKLSLEPPPSPKTTTVPPLSITTTTMAVAAPQPHLEAQANARQLGSVADSHAKDRDVAAAKDLPQQGREAVGQFRPGIIIPSLKEIESELHPPWNLPSAVPRQSRKRLCIGIPSGTCCR